MILFEVNQRNVSTPFRIQTIQFNLVIEKIRDLLKLKIYLYMKLRLWQGQMN